MKKQSLCNAARTISARNLTDNVLAVTAIWEEEISKLTIAYYIKGTILEEEEELCELTLGELIAEFSDIKSADSQCISISDESDDLIKLNGLVYLKPN